MNRKLIVASALAALLAAPFAAQACQAPKTFFVSMLLGKVDAPTVVRLVHSQQLACSRSEAEENLGREVAKEFGSYRILDVITMSVDQGAGQSQRTGRAISTDI